MTTVDLAKAIAKEKPEQGHQIIKACGMRPAKDRNDMIALLNQAISQNKNNPDVLQAFIKCAPAYYEVKYTPCNGGECGCKNADGTGESSGNAAGNFIKNHQKTLIIASAIVLFAIIVK